MRSLLFMTLALSSYATAGETTHEVELDVGAVYVHRHDKLVSPVPYEGALPQVGLIWSPRTERAATHVAVSIALGKLRSGPQWDFTQSDGGQARSAPSSLTSIDVQVAHGRRFGGDKWALNFGGTVALHAEDLAMAYAFTGAGSYFGAIELAPWVDLRVELNKRHGLEVQAWLPLLTWVARSPYSVNSGDSIWQSREGNAFYSLWRYIGSGSMHSLNNYQAVHLDLAWRYDATEKLAVVTRLRSDYAHFNKPQPISEWRIGAHVALRGRF